MVANAMTDAKTNFFIQCSWEIPKWKSMLSTRSRYAQPFFWAVERRGDGINDTTASNAVMHGL
jgi:hypothetical protein